jgi:hypothetical protein
VFETVHEALNDIDRSMYPPVETLPERHASLIAAYEDVAKRFEDEARALGLEDWLRFTIVNRTFGLMHSAPSLDAVRSLYGQMERLGYPSVDPLVSVRMIWAGRLADDGESQEAQTVARQLLADVEEFQKRYPNMLGADTNAALNRFRQRHGI